jgi:hypothetical protein
VRPEGKNNTIKEVEEDEKDDGALSCCRSFLLRAQSRSQTTAYFPQSHPELYRVPGSLGLALPQQSLGLATPKNKETKHA